MNQMKKAKIGRPIKYESEEERKKAKNKKEYYVKFKSKNLKYRCEFCNVTISSYSKCLHLRSKKHILKTQNLG